MGAGTAPAGWTWPTRVAARLAPLLGAGADRVAVTDSTTVNLFQAAVAARRLRPDRPVVLTEDGNFPTDRYVLAGVAELTGAQLVSVPREQLLDRLGDDVAVVAVSHVDYRTGHRHDAAAVTAEAHRAGARHGLGPGPLHRRGARGLGRVGRGPRRRLHLQVPQRRPRRPRVPRRRRARWPTSSSRPSAAGSGTPRPFDFAPTGHPAAGAARFRNGTPPVMSLVGVDEALAGVRGGRHRPHSTPAAASWATPSSSCATSTSATPWRWSRPRDRARRGAQVSLRHPQAYPVMRALIDRRVLGDHRPPDLLRFGFAPALVRHVDVADAVTTLARGAGRRGARGPALRPAAHRDLTAARRTASAPGPRRGRPGRRSGGRCPSRTSRLGASSSARAMTAVPPTSVRPTWAEAMFTPGVAEGLSRPCR